MHCMKLRFTDLLNGLTYSTRQIVSLLLPPTPSHTVLPYSIPTHFVSLEIQFSNGEIHFFITFIRRKNFQQQNENFFFFFHLFNR